MKQRKQRQKHWFELRLLWSNGSIINEFDGDKLRWWLETDDPDQALQQMADYTPALFDIIAQNSEIIALWAEKLDEDAKLKQYEMYRRTYSGAYVSTGMTVEAESEASAVINAVIAQWKQAASGKPLDLGDAENLVAMELSAS